MALDMHQIIKKCYDSTKNSLRITGTAGSMTGQITWTTGLGAIVHILGPSDQNLAINPGTGRSLVVTQASDVLGLRVFKSGAGAGNAVEIENDGTGHSLAIQQDGSGRGIHVTQNNNQEGIQIDKIAAGGGDALFINNDGTGRGLAVQQDGNANGLVIIQNGTGSALDIKGVVTFATGYGAANHITGPSDQDFVLKAGAAGKVMQLDGALIQDVQSVSSSSGTLTVDSSTGNVFTCSLTENITTITWNNAKAGGKYTVVFTQASAGNYTVAFPAAWKWPAGVAPTITTGVGAIDAITVLYDGTNYLADYAQNFS